MTDKKEEDPQKRFKEMRDLYKKESSVEGQMRRDAMKTKAMEDMHNAVTKYLIKKHGEDDKVKGTPKSYDITSHDEAHDMVLEMAKAILKHKHPKMSKEGLDAMLKDEEHLLDVIDTALGQPGAARSLISQLADNPENVVESDIYKQVKEGMGKYVANKKIEHARNYLSTNKDRRDELEKLVNKGLGDHQKELRKGLRQENIVQHLGAMYSNDGKFAKGYVDRTYKNHFKNKPKGK